MTPLVICATCEFVSKECMGRCPCRIDGVDATEHARLNYCTHPSGPKFGSREPVEPAPKPEAVTPLSGIARLVRPGDTLAAMIKAATGLTPETIDPIGEKNCNCKNLQAEMNACGWRGCWQRREQIIEHLVAQGAKIGVTVNRATVAGLFSAALREAFKRRVLRLRIASRASGLPGQPAAPVPAHPS